MRLFLLITLFLGLPGLAQEVAQLERIGETSDQEKISYTEDTKEELSDAVRAISKLLEAARKSGDSDQVACISASLTHTKALLQVTENASSAMNAALDAGQTDRANHEFRKVAIALLKGRELLLEANACTTGGDVDRSGETDVSYSDSTNSSGDTQASSGYEETDNGQDPPAETPFF